MTIQSAVRRPIYTPIARGLQCCSTCPSGSTVDENGVISRLHITICLCDPPVRGLGGETPSNDDVTLTVNGSSVGWTLSNGTAHDLCMTWEVNQPLSYGDTISITFDVGWTNPAGGPTYNVTNLISNPDGALVDTTTGDYLIDTTTSDYLVEAA